MAINVKRVFPGGSISADVNHKPELLPTNSRLRKPTRREISFETVENEDTKRRLHAVHFATFMRQTPFYTLAHNAFVYFRPILLICLVFCLKQARN